MHYRQTKAEEESYPTLDRLESGLFFTFLLPCPIVESSDRAATKPEFALTCVFAHRRFGAACFDPDVTRAARVLETSTASTVSVASCFTARNNSRSARTAPQLRAGVS